MSMEKHVEGFLAALNGGRGCLDAWLECNNEAECRTAILGAVAQEREACAKVCEEFGKEWMCSSTTDEIAASIRMRANA